ncbi:hypothetical protein MRX96_032818 [Rhipicephalus microplus]
MRLSQSRLYLPARARTSLLYRARFRLFRGRPRNDTGPPPPPFFVSTPVTSAHDLPEPPGVPYTGCGMAACSSDCHRRRTDTETPSSFTRHTLEAPDLRGMMWVAPDHRRA